MFAMRILLILLMLKVSFGIVNAEDICVQENFVTMIPTQDLLFVVSTEKALEVLRFDADRMTVEDTSLRLPLSAHQISLSPDGKTIVYTKTIGKTDNISIVDLDTGVSSVLIEKDLVNIVDLHWIDGENIGFVSDAVNQQFTIINTDTADPITYQINITVEQSNRAYPSDWDLSYSLDYSTASFLNFSLGDEIVFWDTLTDTKIDFDSSIPLTWISTGKDFVWMSDNTFWIMDNNLNWQVFSMDEPKLKQVTDTGDRHRLRFPIQSPDMNKVVFEVWNVNLQSFYRTVGFWVNNELIQTCIEVSSGQISISHNGWDLESRFFSLAIYDFEHDSTFVYVVDTEINSVIQILSLDKADSRIRILGWI